ncbi:MAG: antibiotic biosynthesis monooxygenase [Rhodothermia bacterium]|nr:antibiotic biosynthesis monooxygenase [Rhodothermia bacterium]
MNHNISGTPKPPYYAVIFTNSLKAKPQGYEETAQRMLSLAQNQVGFLGIESVRDGLGISVSYWESLDAIRAWKTQTEHMLAQEKGRSDWYAAYKVRICLVERDYGFGLDDPSDV